MSEVENGDSRTITKWGLSFRTTEEPYEVHDTYEQALASFEGMKVKHQYNEHIVRMDITITEVYNGDHWDWEDAYGSRSAKAGIIEMMRLLNQGKDAAAGTTTPTTD